jgi:hypothetical protein
MLSLLGVTLAFALAACDSPSRSSVPPQPSPESLTESSKSAAALPKCASRADVDRLHGQKVRVEALYDVEPSPGGKGLEAAYLLLDDGTELVRSYRPVEAELGFVEKRVVAVGTVYRDAGQAEHIQQLMAPHFYPDHIELAAGETKVEPPPAKRAPPPTIASVAELASRSRRWVQVTATLEGLTAKGDTDWSEGRLKLANGDTIVIPTVYHRHWRELVGTEITVVGKVIATGERPGEAAAIADRAHCKGRVERCSN